MKINNSAPVVATLALGVIAVLSCTSVIGVGEKGILEQFGTVSDRVLQSGFNFKSPLQSVHIMSIKQQKSEEYVMDNVYNVDQQNVTVDFQVIYSLPNDDKALINIYKNYNGDPYQAFALARVKEAIKSITGTYTTLEMVTKSDEFKTKVIAEAQKNIGNIVTINDIIIPNITFDAEIEKAIKDKQVAQQEAEQAKYRLVQAKIEAETAIAKAKGEATALKVKADAISKNPYIVKLKEIEKWDGHYPLGIKMVGGNAVALQETK